MGNKNEIVQMMLDMEYLPSINEEEINKEEYTKIPLEKIATLGGMLTGLSTNARTLTSTLNVEGLYRTTLPKGATQLASFKDGSGFAGSAIAKGKGLVGQARFNSVNNVTQTAVMPIDPITLAMAAMLMSIDAKLDDIKETQKDILEFMKQKEKSQLKANMDFLSDIVNNYKYNYDNKTYIKGHYYQVLQIKREAKESINLYSDTIKEEMKKQKFFHLEKDIIDQKKKILDLFKDYQKALYIHSFSSYVDIILSKNFNQDYLSDVVFNIQKNNQDYKQLYTRFYNMLEKYSKTSIESHLLNSLSVISKTSGELLSKVPVISNSSIDESLMTTGEKLQKLEKQKNTKTLKSLIDVNDSGILMFASNIETINNIYNKPMNILLDQEYLYVNTN